MANEATFKDDPELGRQVRANLEKLFSINKTNPPIPVDKTEIEEKLKDSKPAENSKND